MPPVEESFWGQDSTPEDPLGPLDLGTPGNFDFLGFKQKWGLSPSLILKRGKGGGMTKEYSR